MSGGIIGGSVRLSPGWEVDQSDTSSPFPSTEPESEGEDGMCILLILRGDLVTPAKVVFWWSIMNFEILLATVLSVDSVSAESSPCEGRTGLRPRKIPHLNTANSALKNSTFRF